MYQFPSCDNKVVDVRGMFITLAGTAQDTSACTVHRYGETRFLPMRKTKAQIS